MRRACSLPQHQRVYARLRRAMRGRGGEGGRNIVRPVFPHPCPSPASGGGDAGALPCVSGRSETVAMTKILYVEDNEDNVYMLRRRLERAGFAVVIASSG